jgi:outer membrane protein assembly factor BamB
MANFGPASSNPDVEATDSSLPYLREGAAAPRRRTPPWWVWATLLVPAGMIAFLQTGDRTGDAGATNLLSTALVLLMALLLFAWFVRCRGYTRGLRLGVALGIFLLAAGCGLYYRLQGFSGSLVPSFVPRFQGGGVALPAPAANAANVNLASTGAHDFPGFLGARRDASVEGVRLARDWASRPPQQMWRHAVGTGWSGFAVVNGVAVTLEERGGQQMAGAYDVRTGELKWFHAWPGRFENFQGGPGPRSTPLIDAGQVYVLDPNGLLMCLEGSSGRPIWKHDLLADYGVSPEQEFSNVKYGRSNSPLVVGDLLVVPAGGNPGGRLSNLTAYDKGTGKVVWEGSPLQISFSSPNLATLAGVPQILIVNESSLSGHDPKSGRLLWQHPWPGVTNANASVSQAVPVAPDRVFVSKGYGLGAALLQLVPGAGGALEVRTLWHHKNLLRTKLTNVVIHAGHVYGLSDGILECVELSGGERVWKDGRYGHGQILRVADLLLLLSEDGEVVLIELTPAQPNKVLGRFQALEGKTWNNFALYEDVLLIRNDIEAAAYRLPLEQAEPGA